jgi:pyruvate-formate lyase-activating enzyme
MGIIAISAFLDRRHMAPEGVVVTFITPGGCNLACPFCVVSGRGERFERSRHSPEHFGAFLRAFSKRGLLGGAAVVGDEPLQSQAWPYARAFLEDANRCGTPTALITNGVELAAYIPDLELLAPSQIIVSVDAVNDRHDAIRRKHGAFAAIDSGLRLAAASPLLRHRLVVGTILMPGKADDVRSVILHSASLGLQRSYVSPLIVVSEGAPLRVHPKVLASGLELVPQLRRLAADLGVDLALADDFGSLGDWARTLRAAGVEVRTPVGPTRLLRVDAGGGIALYDDIRAGRPPRFRLPESPAGMDDVVTRIVEAFSPDVRVAA